MTADSREHVELIALIESVLTDSATARDVSRLDELLGASEAARSIYLDYADLHAELRRKYAYPVSESSDAGAVTPAPSERPASGTSRRRPVAVLLAVAASLLLALVLQNPEAVGLQAWRDAAGPKQAGRQKVAVLSQSLDAQWGFGSRSYDEGADIPTGELVLESGIVQLDFYDGAVVVVEGPARMTLWSSMVATLSSGKLQARVPKRATGFTIDTPLGKVVDLGTEFALQLNERGDRGELHVLTGKVRFDPKRQSTGDSVELLTGQGLAISRNQNEMIDSGDLAGRFVGPTEVESLARLRGSERYSDWNNWREELLADPALVAYYGYSPEAQWSRTLRNFAPKGGDDTHGVVVGGEWMPGRWPGHKAITFRNASHRVSVNLPAKHDSMTLAAWVHVDQLPFGQDVSLIHSEYQAPSYLRWSLESVSPTAAVSHFMSMQAPTASDPDPTPAHYNSQTWALRPDDYRRWVHLAVTYNAETKRVTHYRNGEVIHVIKVASPEPLRIGSADIGNIPLRSKARWPNKDTRNLAGSLDEFVVVGRALSAEEMGRMYRVGSP